MADFINFVAGNGHALEVDLSSKEIDDLGMSRVELIAVNGEGNKNAALVPFRERSVTRKNLLQEKAATKSAGGSPSKSMQALEAQKTQVPTGT